jgi:5-(aminomethyl)-3-furanmethanol phosphate kinase
MSFDDASALFQRFQPFDAPLSMVKIGGSILDDVDASRMLVRELEDTCPPAVILTGGGQAAKRIKMAQQQHGLDFMSAWRAGVLTLDLNATFLSGFSKRLQLVRNFAEADDCLRLDRLPVLAPFDMITRSGLFEASWEVSTDSYGLQLAHMLHAVRYVVVTNVDGILEGFHDKQGTLVESIDAQHLLNLESSKLDARFVGYANQIPIPTMIVNGTCPSRVLAAIEGTRTRGTLIAPHAS